METKQMGQFKRELFEKFLVQLSNFLSKNALVENGKIETVFVQTPKDTFESLIAKGVVKIGDSQYIVIAEMNKYGNVELRSKAFWYYLKLDEVIAFLDEVSKRDH